MIYIIITSCLQNSHDKEIRKEQYIKGINKIIELCNELKEVKIVIVENNGKRETFLDDFGLDVLYTNNNLIETNNISIKEISDIKSCIKQYNIRDDELIIKITGRYILHDDNNLIKIIQIINNNNKPHMIMKFSTIEDKIVRMVIAGCYGLLSVYFKEIVITSNIENALGNLTLKIPKHLICRLNYIGIYQCPGSNNYSLI